MKANAPELKRIVNDVVGTTASSILLKRLFTVIDEAKDEASLKSTATRVERLVALFLSADQAKTLGTRFSLVLD